MKKYTLLVTQRLSHYEMSNRDALFFLIGISLLFFFPLLFLGKIFLNGDATYYAYPVAYFFKYHLGEAINTFIFSGYPVTDAFQIGFFNPLYTLFFYLFDFIIAYHTLLFINFCGAAIFTYLFARELRISVYGSVIASIAYAFGQLAIAWVAVIAVANSIILLPMMLYLIAKMVKGKKWYCIILGVAIGLAFLATHYQFVVLALIGAGAYLLFEAIARWNRQYSVNKNCIPVYLFVCSVCIGFLVSIPQTFHSIALFAESTRSSILVYNAAWYSDLIRYLIPTFNLPYISIVEFRPYIGIIPLFFASIAFFVYRKKALTIEGRFFFWLFLICLILSLKYSPLLILVKQIPFIKYFAEQSRWLYLGNFGLVLGAGFGFDYIIQNAQILKNEILRTWIKRFCVFSSVSIVGVNIALFFWGSTIISYLQSYFDANLYETTTKLPIGYYHRLIEIMANNVFLNVSFLNPNIIIFLVSIFILFGLLHISDNKKLFSNTVILAVTVNLIAFSFTTLNLTNRDVLVTPSQIGELIKSREANPFEYRVLGFLVPYAQYQKITALNPEAENESLEFAREALMGNVNVFSEIPIVGGYDPLAFRRYQNLVAFLENSLGKSSIDQKIATFITRQELFSMMNVKYIVTPYEIASPYLKHVARKEITRFEVPLYVYENLKVMPRIYVATNVSFLKENSENESFSNVTGTGINFHATTFIECDLCIHSTSTNNRQVESKLIRNDAHGFDMSIVNSDPEWIVIGNEAVPGWKARLNGVPTRIYYANHAYQAVYIPPGEHTLTLQYDAMPTIQFSF